MLILQNQTEVRKEMTVLGGYINLKFGPLGHKYDNTVFNDMTT